MEELTKTIYKAMDGKIFESKAACEKHEQVIAERAKRTTYWSVTHSPDLTEGRGFYGLTLVECYGPETYNVEMLMRDWCFRIFGRPVAFVQGVSPMPAWSLHKIEAEVFWKGGGEARVGDGRYAAKKVHLVIGEREIGLIERAATPATQQHTETK
ncbi:hypothetical protein [Cupriavidus necator]